MTSSNLRRLLAGAALALCAFAAAAQSPLRAVGLFSVLGETMDVAVTDEPSASRLDKTIRNTLEVKGIGFDRAVATEVKAAIDRLRPAPALHLFGASGTMKNTDQRLLSSNARRGGLPGWVIQPIEQHKLSHVLLVTRHRAPASLLTADGTRIGQVELEGLGFHVDNTYIVRNVQTGAVTRGALGPNVLVELLLIDVADGRVVGSEVIDKQWLVGSREGPVEGGPWNYLNPTEKVAALHQALAAGLREALPRLLSSK